MSIPCTIDCSKIIKFNPNEKNVVVKPNSTISLSLEMPFDYNGISKHEVLILIYPGNYLLSFFIDDIHQLIAEHQEIFKDFSCSSYMHIVTFDEIDMIPRKYLEDIMTHPQAPEIYWRSFTNHTLDLFVQGRK